MGRFRKGLEKSLDDLKQTLDQTLLIFGEKQQEITGRVSKQRQAYVDKIEVRFSKCLEQRIHRRWWNF